MGRNPHFGAQVLSGFEVPGSFAFSDKREKTLTQLRRGAHSNDHVNVTSLHQAGPPDAACLFAPGLGQVRVCEPSSFLTGRLRS